MPAELAIVTDSTAYLPQDEIDRHRISVVPLSVVLGDAVLTEGVEIAPKDVAEALRAKQQLTTSRPNPETFAAAYRAAAEAGATGVVSVHLSGELSGTSDAARLAAAEAPVPVRVVDSRLVGMALGYPVLAAAEARDAGLDLDGVAEAASRRAELTRGYFYVDTLEHLRRGGRIGAARALIGSALAVKPLLHLDGGRIEPLEKVRTASRAIARLEELAVEQALAGEGPVDITVHHLAAEDRAAALAERLRERVPGLRSLYVGEVGAVIGAHVGPGMLAVVVSVESARSTGSAGALE
ncbi:fatty acid-binding protein DegV [Streptomyces tateyamensis]|uniref:Fatty acid-binding protein DegV n=1 Tax=Streptomyces tateyamensis TaxID=565073 RepID=A0A2V4NMG8_9ACTN|nr:DegV family protein [Streptomyces tateyamensis]PYC77094.1 fatty acid-binding protein DegV [Streptomyces tateyamensis]